MVEAFNIRGRRLQGSGCETGWRTVAVFETLKVDLTVVLGRARMPLHMLTLGNKLTATTGFGKEMREQLPNGVREIKAMIAADMSAEPFLELPLETLIMVGEKSPAYFGVACGRLHEVLSGSAYSVIPGLGHDGVNRAPARLIEPLAEFFAG